MRTLIPALTLALALPLAPLQHGRTDGGTRYRILEGEIQRRLQQLIRQSREAKP